MTYRSLSDYTHPPKHPSSSTPNVNGLQSHQHTWKPCLPDQIVCLIYHGRILCFEKVSHHFYNTLASPSHTTDSMPAISFIERESWISYQHIQSIGMAELSLMISYSLNWTPKKVSSPRRNDLTCTCVVYDTTPIVFTKYALPSWSISALVNTWLCVYIVPTLIYMHSYFLIVPSCTYHKSVLYLRSASRFTKVFAFRQNCHICYSDSSIIRPHIHH